MTHSVRMAPAEAARGATESGRADLAVARPVGAELVEEVPAATAAVRANFAVEDSGARKPAVAHRAGAVLVAEAPAEADLAAPVPGVMQAGRNVSRPRDSAVQLRHWVGRVGRRWAHHGRTTTFRLRVAPDGRPDAARRRAGNPPGV